MSDKPLTGVRILDLTRVLSGPFMTMLLCDMGAEVIKLESLTGDDSRYFFAVCTERRKYVFCCCQQRQKKHNS